MVGHAAGTSYAGATPARITRLCLTAFKSFHDVVVPLEPLASLTGRNGSGKSNALDALHRLATVGDVRDALEITCRDSAPIRRGIEGCTPFGSDTFQLGVRIARANGQVVHLDVRVRVRPTVQIVGESLRLANTDIAMDNDDAVHLLEAEAPESDSADIDGRVWNGRPGPNPRSRFRATHLLTGQLPVRLPGENPEQLVVLAAANDLLSTLGGVFHFDPVPHLMREYVPERDIVLLRNGENLSAAVAALRNGDPTAFDTLVDVVKRLPEQSVHGMEVRSGGLGEVMLGLRESDGDLAGAGRRARPAPRSSRPRRWPTDAGSCSPSCASRS